MNDAEVPDEAVTAALAAREHALMDRPDPMVLSDETLMRETLEAAAPFIRNQTLLAMREAMLAEVDAATVKAMTARLGEMQAAVRGAEQERIAQLADRNEAVCVGDEGTSCYFSALIREQP